MTTKTTKAVRMTDLEARLLEAVFVCEFHDGANPIGHGVWTNVATETLGKSAQGAITSAKRKGWVGSTQEGRESCIWITAAGARALQARFWTAGKRGTNVATLLDHAIEAEKTQNARDVAAAVGPAQPTKVRLMKTVYAEVPLSQIGEFDKRLDALIEEMNNLAGADLYDMDNQWDETDED